MAMIVQHSGRPNWGWHLLAFFGRLNRLGPAPADAVTDVNSLSDRQLLDIGVERTDLGKKFDREMAELRRRSLGPLA